jgi:hypothetical protein
MQAQHRFARGVEAREEGGTQNILGIVRAAMPLQLQALLGRDETHAISAGYALRAINTWQLCPSLHLVGGDWPAFHSRDRAPIVAFNVTVRTPDGSEHRGRGGHRSSCCTPHFVAAVLNDVYGIQVRFCGPCRHTAPATVLYTMQHWCMSVPPANATPRSLRWPCMHWLTSAPLRTVAVRVRVRGPVRRGAARAAAAACHGPAARGVWARSRSAKQRVDQAGQGARVLQPPDDARGGRLHHPQRTRGRARRLAAAAAV